MKVTLTFKPPDLKFPQVPQGIFGGNQTERQGSNHLFIAFLFIFIALLLCCFVVLLLY